MNIKGLFEKWHLDSLKVNTKFLELEFKPGDKDKDAAWALYVELLTRVTTQALKDDEGNEESALELFVHLQLNGIRLKLTVHLLKKAPNLGGI